MNLSDWLSDNLGTILFLILIFILFVMMVLFFVLKQVNRIAKETIENTLNVKADYLATTEQQKDIKVSIYNSNFRDIIISAFGFIYHQQRIDFLGSYQKNWSQGDSKVVVSARSNIDYTIPVELLESIIFANNFKFRRIKRLGVYVIDSIGARKVVPCREIRSILTRRLKARQEQEKLEMISKKGTSPWYSKLMFWQSTTDKQVTPIAFSAPGANTMVKKPKKPKADPVTEESSKEE